LELAADAWQPIKWRDGSNTALRGDKEDGLGVNLGG